MNDVSGSTRPVSIATEGFPTCTLTTRCSACVPALTLCARCRRPREEPPRASQVRAPFRPLRGTSAARPPAAILGRAPPSLTNRVTSKQNEVSLQQGELELDDDGGREGELFGCGEEELHRERLRVWVPVVPRHALGACGRRAREVPVSEGARSERVGSRRERKRRNALSISRAWILNEMVWYGSAAICTKAQHKNHRQHAAQRARKRREGKRGRRTRRYCQLRSGTSTFCSNADMKRCRGRTPSLISG